MFIYGPILIRENNKLTPNYQVINYASGNISSWDDIHASAENGRLVFVSDSAGHPRYRRTAVRGLVGWAPHWTVLCVAADDGENAPSAAGGTSSAQDILGTVCDPKSKQLKACHKFSAHTIDSILDGCWRRPLKSAFGALPETGQTFGRRDHEAGFSFENQS